MVLSCRPLLDLIGVVVEAVLQRLFDGRPGVPVVLKHLHQEVHGARRQVVPGQRPSTAS